MEARHEIISFDRNNPVRLYMHKLGDVTRHWHESLELLFVLAGEVTVLAGDIQTLLKQDDMLLINSNITHELHSDDCVMIAVQVKLSKFDLPPDLLQSLYFRCDSTSTPDKERFHTIKQIIASMLQSNAGKESSLFHNRALAYRLLSELVQNFKAEKPAAEANTRKHLERLNNILHFIGEHYREQLTLNQLADREHLSAPYLSSFFEKYMGVNFSTYYTNLRLDHAVQDLLHTDIPVEQIAINNGFSDPRAFVRAFKKRYNSIPSVYRKSSAPLPAGRDTLLSINYLDFKPENYLHILSQYLPDAELSTVLPSTAEQKRELTVKPIDCAAPGIPLLHKWRTFIGVGRAKELLQAEVQDMLRQLQKDVGFRYLRFHGIFSDDMLVCHRDADGTLRFSFTLIDKALDFILSVGLKPLIQFSFMPSDIAANPKKTIFANPFIISPPRRMEDWNTLVGMFLSHIRNRYGKQEIRSWLYSVWNEPDTSIQMFGFEDDRQFYTLYENTAKTVRAFDPELVFGSPSLYPTTDHEIAWLQRFLSNTRDNDCVPQFMDIHYYSDDFENFDQSNTTYHTQAGFSDDPDHFSKYLTKMHAVMAKCGIDQIPLYLTEWNLTVSHRNLINDTCFKGTYVAKNFLDNYDRADALGYWSLTDLIEENQPPHETFHGGLGLFTQNGIKKPPYYVMVLMRQLGDTLLNSGDGWFVTRRENGSIAAVLYNYQHFDPLFLQEGFGLTQTAREGVFPRRTGLEVTLPLEKLPGGMYRIRETILNQGHGSAFDRWVEMGAPELSPCEISWLRDSSQPDLRIYRTSIAQNSWTYRAEMAPHEVRLVEIIPADSGFTSS